MEYNTKFTLKDSLRKNSGIYKIVAENVHGKDEAEVEIVVLGERLACFTTKFSSPLE